MKQIALANQPWLGVKQTIRITVNGIRYRFFRASVTVAVIAVALAFLMNILSESIIKRSVARNTRNRINQMRLVYLWSTRLTTPGSLESVLTEVAEAQIGSDEYLEMERLGRFTPAQMAEFHCQARKGLAYIRFFADLDYGKRRNLVHTASGVEIFERLSTQAGMKQFKTSLAQIKSIRFVSTQDELEQFLTAWPELKIKIRRVLEGRQKAIATVNAALAGRSILEALADSTGDFGRTIREAGFVFDAKTVAPLVAVQARRQMDVMRLEKSIKHRAICQLIAQQADVLPSDVNAMTMWNLLESPKFADAYLQKMKESRLDVSGLRPEYLVELAKARKERAALLRAEQLTMDTGDGLMGIGERLTWLLFVSMLVCGIGICNAMLMAVTERFTEIATMKCLGALDGFIMITFVLESMFLGIIGGVIGAVVGALIGSARMLATFGIGFLGAVPVLELLIGMMVSVVIGIILAALAAVLPSIKAARLAPMEAMRIE